MTQTGKRTIEQERAANALARVHELSRDNDGNADFKKRYRAYVDRICPNIVMSGLGQALAMERAAAGPTPTKDDQRAHRELYTSLQRWLCRDKEGVYPASRDLLEAMMNHDESHYLHAQAEALAWLEWHKKFCRAEFPAGQAD